MQPKFTKRKGLMLLQKTLTLFLLGIASFVNAQTISTASGSNYLGNLSIGNTNPLNVSFVIQNTTGAAVSLTDVSCHMAPFTGTSVAGDASVTKLFVSSTSLSGVYDYSTAAWTQIASGNAVVPATLSFIPVITGINYSIPAGAQLRFVLELSKGIRISSNLVGDPMPTPNVFSSGGINLQLGDFQIAGQNVGFGGVAPTAPAGNTPVFFGGSVTLISSVPCTGTPAPGATLPATSAACPGAPFNLSLQTATTGSGVTYQWQSGPSATGPWANISGAINASYSGTITATTYFRANVTCSGNTGTSTPAVVNLNPPSACYCANTATDPADEDIFNVTLGTLNNTSTCASTGPGFGSVNSLYANYTSGTGAPAAPDVYQGANNPFSVQVGTCGGNWGNAVAIWIDLNKDGTFQHPAEQVYVSPASTTGPHFETGNLVIPPSALLGTTRMRVQVREFGTAANMLPCGTFTWGEVEDYNVNIVPCVPALVSSSPSSASVTCGQNISFTAAATGSLPAFSWEWRPNSSSAWFAVTNGGIYSGANTPTLTLTNVSAAYSGYQYRAVVVGACSATDVSQVATLTVNPLIATVSPVSSTICKGAIVPLTLTNASSPSTVTFTNNTPLVITDDSPAGVFSTINVSGIPAAAIITDVSIKLNITHTYVGDLEISVKAPNAAIMNLIGELDGGTGSNSSDNFVNTVISNTGTTPLSGAPAPRTGKFAADRLSGYGPSGAYQTLPNGMPWSTLLTTINGNWVLGLSDWYAGDEGTLQNWSISITYGAPAAGVWEATPSVLPQPNSMFTDALATVPYVAGSQATTIYVKPDVSTNYSVVYSTTTPCTSPATVIPVTVNFPVTGLTVAPATRAVCLGGSTTFTASVAGGSPVTYQWQQSVDGGLVYTNISGATSSTLTISGVTATMTGYKYRVVATGGVCGAVTSTAIGTLTVNTLPVITLSSPDMMIIPGQTTSVTATSTPAAQATTSWSWTLNGAAISGNTNVVSGINIDQIGTYQARVTDVNGCVNTSAQLVIGAEASDKLWIYPNPTTGEFYVRLYFSGELTEIRKVSLYNPAGQLLETRDVTLINTANPYQRMDFSLGGNIAKGTYVIKVAHKASGKVISGLIVVQ